MLKSGFTLLALAAFLSACAPISPSLSGTAPLAASPVADTLYVNGDILPMEGKEPAYVEALAVKDGKISFVGARADAPKAAQTVDLGGKTLLPGFIDSHGHMVAYGKNLIDADLVGTPDIPDLLARMRAHARTVPAGAWIVGFGYSAKNMKENRTPTVGELDTVSTTTPVMIVDSSGHLGAGNSALFAIAGVGPSTADPVGGTFSRQAGGKALAGPMEETALNLVREKRPAFEGQMADNVILGGAKAWASMGQTSAQDCGIGLGSDDMAILRNAINKNLLPIDLYLCAKDSIIDPMLAQANEVRVDAASGKVRMATRVDGDTHYINRVRMGGIKFWLDGSVDTAWFTQPFTNNPPGKTGVYLGYEQIPDEVLNAAFDRFWNTDIQINMHMNGDAAADQALRAIEKAVKKYGMRDHRPVFIHASYLRSDQIEKMRTYGAVPSFLTASIPPAGDAVVYLWGPERAATSLAAATFVREGLPFTFSHDAPVSPSPSILAIVDAGVNRIAAKSGRVIGSDQRVSPYQALRAVTAYGAYQIHEETTKGTLEVGKLADLVILDANPLRVTPTSIKSIKVLETIKEGVTVFRLVPTPAR
jgi:predicted amidohydrolase YtcJ